jgi:hypothetical protein
MFIVQLAFNPYRAEEMKRCGSASQDAIIRPYTNTTMAETNSAAPVTVMLAPREARLGIMWTKKPPDSARMPIAIVAHATCLTMRGKDVLSKNV